jgi:transcriptional regulator with XRE-family HTH domain
MSEDLLIPLWHAADPAAEEGVASLAAFRRRVPWTQRELATAAGVAVSTVRAIERGAYKSVRPRVIRALAATLRVDPALVTEFRPSLGLPPEVPDPESGAGRRD